MDIAFPTGARLASHYLHRQRGHVNVLDVRQPGEYACGHIARACNVPLDVLSEHTSELRAAGRAPLVLVCEAGTQAEEAEQFLRSAGLPRFHVLAGRMAAWRSALLPVIGSTRRWTMERQVRGVAGSITLASALDGLTIWPPATAIAVAIGGGLTLSAVTNTGDMAAVVGRMPWNRGAPCDIASVIADISNASPTLNGGSHAR